MQRRSTLITNSNIWHGPAELREVVIFLKQFGTALWRKDAYQGGAFAVTEPLREEPWALWIDDPVSGRQPKPDPFGRACALAIDARQTRDFRKDTHIRAAPFGFSVNIKDYCLAFAGFGQGTRGQISDVSFLLLAIFAARMASSDELNAILTRNNLRPYFANEIRKEIKRLVPLCNATAPTLRSPVAA